MHLTGQKTLQHYSNSNHAIAGIPVQRAVLHFERNIKQHAEPIVV
jgi:hypothetical protein